MWLFTETGFVSAVVDKDNSSRISVRARDKQSLQSFVDEYGVKIVELPGRDYEYRIYLTKEQLADWTVARVNDLSYTNFKNRVHQSRGNDFAAPLHDVWYSMLEVSDKRPKKTKRGSLASRWYEDDSYFVSNT